MKYTICNVEIIGSSKEQLSWSPSGPEKYEQCSYFSKVGPDVILVKKSAALVSPGTLWYLMRDLFLMFSGHVDLGSMCFILPMVPVFYMNPIAAPASTRISFGVV